MKKSSAFIIMAMVYLFACQEPREDFTSLPENTSLKTVGEQITLEEARRWMDLFKKNKSQGREGIPFSIPKETLENMLNSTTELVGVAYHYGIDGNGTEHIIAAPVDNSLKIWNQGTTRIFVDANSGTAIDLATAKAWAESFKAANPESIWFHFFGKDVFDEILAISYFTDLDIEPALNDLLEPQLLLIIYDELTLISGKTEEDEVTVYDASNPCPPCEIESE